VPPPLEVLHRASQKETRDGHRMEPRVRRPFRSRVSRKMMSTVFADCYACEDPCFAVECPLLALCFLLARAWGKYVAVMERVPEFAVG
jgi:hypothetical protein